MPSEETRIYTVFMHRDKIGGLAGRPIGFDAYRKHHPETKLMENRQVLEAIERDCKDVRFLGGPDPVKVEKAVLDLEEQDGGIDGLLVFGNPPDTLIQKGLPLVAVSLLLEDCTTTPFRAYKNSKVLTAFLPMYRDKDPAVYSLRVKDIAGKVRLMDAVSRMRRLRALVITDRPVLGYFEPEDYQIETSREEYERTYLENLEATFGTQLITAPQEELFGRIEKADENRAKIIAEKWITEAMGLRGTNESEVVRSAKLYVAMKEMMEQYSCSAVTTEGFGWPPLGGWPYPDFRKAVERGIPSQGIPTSQLLSEGIVATSETLMDCLLTQQLGLYVTGSPGFLGDYNIDPFLNMAIVCHCEGSFRPYGDERQSPYVIRNLPFTDENTGGVCAEIHYPTNDTVTAVKISMYRKKLSIFTGQTVSGEDFFPYWEDILGRTKIAIKTNAEALLENVDWQTFGNHRIVFFGDHRRKFKDLARLIEYEVVEEDA